MAKYEVKGYSKVNGSKKTIVVDASTERHARTVAYGQLTYPKVIRKL